MSRDKQCDQHGLRPFALQWRSRAWHGATEEYSVADSAKSQIPRRAYRDDVKLSIIGLGGIAVVGLSDLDCRRLVERSLERGVNYFDLAPTYGNGEAEEKLGAALQGRRDEVFLACKTTERSADGARRELEQSLRRARTDHFDLYQFHGVLTLEQVEQIMAPGGAGEVLLEARRQGKARYLGLTAHSEEAAIAVMDRFPCDSVAFPINFVCYARSGFGARVVEHARRKGVACLAIKAMAQTRWPEGAEKKYPKCWYQPIEDPELARRALRFTLSEGVTTTIPPADRGLFEMALDLAADLEPMGDRERHELLALAQGIEPIFPW